MLQEVLANRPNDVKADLITLTRSLDDLSNYTANIAKNADGFTADSADLASECVDQLKDHMHILLSAFTEEYCDEGGAEQIDAQLNSVITAAAVNLAEVIKALGYTDSKIAISVE